VKQIGDGLEGSRGGRVVWTCNDQLLAVTGFDRSVFTARCYASAVLAMALCPAVCLSVCPSQVGVLLKQLNVGSHKQHHTIAQGL